MGRSNLFDYPHSKSCHEMRKKFSKDRRKLRILFWNELSTLLPSGGTPVPRVDKLQSLEAKMANIEVSLGWRRRREALLETLPRAARDLVRELDSLHQSVREKDSNIQLLKNQITNLGGTVSGGPEGTGVIVSEAERKSIQERLDKVQSEIDAKKVAVKNLKLSLDKIDVTDNIDVRIRAAEMEYELEREELNILNLKEEASVLTTRLQESSVTPTVSNTNGDIKTHISFQDLLTKPSSSSVFMGSTLFGTEVAHTTGNPPFHVTFRAPFGCVIDWATEESRLKKGDKLVEINSESVLGKSIDSVTKLMSGSSRLAIVVARPTELLNGVKKFEKILEENLNQNKDLVAKLDKALKERDTFKNDNTRLSHRISYLEDQVSELQGTLQKAADAALVTGSPNEVLTPSQPGATIIQVFQKGEQTLAVAETETAKAERVQEYPTLPRLKSPSNSSTCSTPKGEERVRPPTKVPRPPIENSPHYRHSDVSLPHLHDDSDYSDYQILSPRLRDYDSIEKLRDRITERSPSYSYRNRDHFRISAGDHYTTPIPDHQRPKRTNHDVESVYGTPIKRKSGSDIEPRSAPDGRPGVYSRPSSREDFIEAVRSESRQSRSSVGYDRPPRRVLSPGSEVRSEDSRSNRPRPIPPKKPERLSLQRTTSMLSVEDIRACSRASSISSASKSHPNISPKEGELSFLEDSRISCISEERLPNPSPRNITHRYRTREQRCPTMESPVAMSSPLRRPNSPDAGDHLDHEEVKGPRPAVRRSLEPFQAPPTPNTPPRGINLSMTNSSKENEEWC